jgi:hypothetical protein
MEGFKTRSEPGRGREGLRMMGMGTWRKPSLLSPLAIEGKAGSVFPDASHSYGS